MVPDYLDEANKRTGRMEAACRGTGQPADTGQRQLYGFGKWERAGGRIDATRAKDQVAA